MSLNTIEEAIEDFKNGKFLIVVDDEDRENEGLFLSSGKCSGNQSFKYSAGT